jgi:hypothetical protein
VLPGMKWRLRLLELVVFRWRGVEEVVRSCFGVDAFECDVCVRGCALYELAIGCVPLWFKCVCGWSV